MASTIEEVAAALGITVRGARLRIDALGRVVDPFKRRTPTNRLLYAEEALGMLRHLEELRKRDGLSITSAAQQVRDHEDERLQGESEGGGRYNQVKQAEAMPGEWVRALLDEKDRAIERLEEEVVELRAQVERLLPLALPRPRRGLLARLRRRGD